MTNELDRDSLQAQLEQLIGQHDVPGASVAVLQGDEVIECAAGVVNKRTGVEVTTDTVFQIGSVTKVWTATLVMMAVGEGLVDLDEPVSTYLPELRFADPDVTKQVTLRHFLSHSSGVGGDHILDTGRGDDTLANYVETCAELGQEFELGATMSYCNTGYSLSGRVLEKVYGKTWDAIIRERIFTPLGLTHAGTLPEEAILWRAAVGHVKLPGAEESDVAPFWVLPRSAGPAGLVNCTAAESLAFARLHLDGGRAPDGTQLLAPELVKLMQEPQVDVPDRYSLGDKWGLGWILFDWDGRRLFGHDGDTVGQHALLRVLPEPRVAIAICVNGGSSRGLFRPLVKRVFGEAAGVEVPELPPMPEAPADLDLSLYEGSFARLNVSLVLRDGGDGRLRMKTKLSGPLADMLPKGEEDKEVVVTPVDRELFLIQAEESPTPTPFTFFDFDGDRPRRVHYGARAMTRQD